MKTDQISPSKMAGSALGFDSYPVFTRVSRFGFEMGCYRCGFIFTTAGYFCDKYLPTTLCTLEEVLFVDEGTEEHVFVSFTSVFILMSQQESIRI